MLPFFRNVPRRAMTINEPMMENEENSSPIYPAILILSEGRLALVKRPAILGATAMRMFLQVLFRYRNCFPFLGGEHFRFFRCGDINYRVDCLGRKYLFVRPSFCLSNDRRGGVYVLFRVRL